MYARQQTGKQQRPDRKERIVDLRIRDIRRRIQKPSEIVDTSGQKQLIIMVRLQLE